MEKAEFLQAVNNGVYTFKVNTDLLRKEGYSLDKDEIICLVTPFKENDEDMYSFNYCDGESRFDPDTKTVCNEVTLNIGDLDRVIESKFDVIVGKKLDFTDTNKHYTKPVQFIEHSQMTMHPDDFRGAMLFTIGKYCDRFGKKDDIQKEAKKILDYALWLTLSAKGKKIDPTKHNHEVILKALGFEEE